MNKTGQVSICFALLLVLIAATPALATTPGWLGPQFVTLVTALILVLLPSVAESDIRRGLASIRTLVPLALFPALWAFLQILPLPLGSIDHPIWRSASAALGEHLFGHISIDLGFTLRALFQYLSLCLLCVVTTALCRNRERAEIALFALCAITVVAAAELLLVAATSSVHDTFHDSLTALALLGSIINTAFLVRAVERHQTRRLDEGDSGRKYLGMMLLALLAIAICLAALVYSSTIDMLIINAFGLAPICLVVLVRRLNLTRWTTVTVASVLVVAGCGVIALRSAFSPAVNPIVRFSHTEPAQIEGGVRMLADAGWTGAGFGTYKALAAIYRDATGAPSAEAINTIESIVLEGGYLVTLLVFALVLQLSVVLFRGALSRGRDSFYAAGACGCLVALFCEAYFDASLVAPAAAVLISIMVGLGLAQVSGSRKA